MLTAKLLAHTSVSPTTAVIVALLVGLAIGLANAVVVVVFKIDPFIGTLATSSLLGALSLFISGNRTIASERLIGDFTEIARYKILGVTAPVWYMLVVAVILWYLLEHTATGRHIYAIGFSLETARLSGINTQRIRFMSLVLSAFVSGLAGVVLTARITVGSPTIGPPFLLPAFAACVRRCHPASGRPLQRLGHPGLRLYLIGTGNTGLSLAGAPLWAPQVLVGITLIVAIALTGVKRSVK